MTASKSIVKKAKSILDGASSILLEAVNRGLAVFKGFIMKKKCLKCGQEKDIVFFSKDRTRLSGLQSWCKICRAESSKSWKQKNKKRHCELNRKWEQKNREKVNKTKSLWRKNNKEIYNESRRRWKRKHPIAHIAHYMVNNEIYNGKLIKLPCEICGTTNNIHAHHPDYSKPLNIIWLCRKHHIELHSNIFKKENVNVNI